MQEKCYLITVYIKKPSGGVIDQGLNWTECLSELNVLLKVDLRHIAYASFHNEAKNNSTFPRMDTQVVHLRTSWTSNHFMLR